MYYHYILMSDKEKIRAVDANLTQDEAVMRSLQLRMRTIEDGLKDSLTNVGLASDNHLREGDAASWSPTSDVAA